VNGYPIRVSELLAQLEGARYLERTAINTPQNIMKTKKALSKAFKNQVDGVGFSLVEVLSTCPTNWGMDPVASMEFLSKDMMKHYPLGVYKDVNGGK
ncbi:MAG TPA: 2-oxoglutarate oxidoreductase, partial [Elusimicrobiales bacterium]|nr:2-oxoglutarate oxidoreductase [Elusimicrobiales bacterium]